jgi:NADPH-dependent 2,4-dienoyl-CoA reductase/sulfur reductase-like enzyme
MTTVDLLIVGAGPAGMAAAVEAAARGLSVLVLDEALAPGGRIWQALETRGDKDPDDAPGLALIKAFRSATVDARFRATVWAIEPDGTVYWSEAGQARGIQARQILLATGTTERPLPIPGWTLPGVMTVGAAQIAMKTGGLVPEGAVWLAGQGPLLLLYAVQALAAGGEIAGIIDLSPPRSRWRTLRQLPGALTAWPDLQKGLQWRRTIARAKVRWVRASELHAHGIEALTSISFTQDVRRLEEPAETLLLHDGVIPSVQLSRALGCAHHWNAAQSCWQPTTDRWGQSSLPQVLIAGDGAGIGGALAAVAGGRIAALAAAATLGRIDAATRDAAAGPCFAERHRHRAIRPLLDALYPPHPADLLDTTLVCRCEEVSAQAVRDAAALGCRGLNQLKAYTRCGMGPCQGRMCAPTAARVLATAWGIPVTDIEPLRTRFPTKPVSVGELAALQTPE